MKPGRQETEDYSSMLRAVSHEKQAVREAAKICPAPVTLT